jgi:hypothetical protein
MFFKCDSVNLKFIDNLTLATKKYCKIYLFQAYIIIIIIIIIISASRNIMFIIHRKINVQDM